MQSYSLFLESWFKIGFSVGVSVGLINLKICVFMY